MRKGLSEEAQPAIQEASQRLLAFIDKGLERERGTCADAAAEEMKTDEIGMEGKEERGDQMKKTKEMKADEIGMEEKKKERREQVK